MRICHFIDTYATTEPHGGPETVMVTQCKAKHLHFRQPTLHTWVVVLEGLFYKLIR